MRPSAELGIGTLLLVAGFFWRGRRKSRDVVEEQPAALARRIPPVMLVNLGVAAAPADLEFAPPLGARDDVREQVTTIVGSMAAAEDGRAVVHGPGWSLTLNFGSDDPVWTIAIEARGDESTAPIEKLARETGWQIFVPRLGKFADPATLSDLTASSV